ncbi:60S ribosomal protein L28-like [Apodemus sylvaticus]|uniref:60S ribosomal protein L28-like n=1 Tax=Apodemus sylvaticus TaxID=10129 RepID=UPI002243986C|nr:60S ribosomal protein L28-like [Apodemus sylvaticus]
MSVHPQWMILQNCSSYSKRNKQMYSSRPNNLKAHNSLQLIYLKTLGPVAHGERIIMIMKQRFSTQNPASSYMRTTINKNILTTLCSIRHMICKSKSHPDMSTAAI